MKQEKKNKPNKVSNAVTLLWIVIAVGVIRSIFSFSSSLETANASGLGLLWLIFTLYFSFLLLAFFIYKIGQGKNWARITYLVFFIIGFPFAIYSYLMSAVSTLSIILGIAGMIVQIVALVFLFQEKSSDWFKSMKN